MILHFLRTGEKRYAIEIERNGYPILEMNPAPGYDPKVPHDMMHLVVEAVLGLDRAVFGQIAAGGDAGSFHVKQDSSDSGRENSRRRRKQKKRSEKILQTESGDFAISERATYVCWYGWLSRSASPDDRMKAASMREGAVQIESLMSERERRSLETNLEVVCRHLDDLSATWSDLKVGERMSVRWPDLAIIHDN